MGLWTLLLLHFHLAVCVCLPAPSNVSISSYNMEHILRFSPGPGTPPDALFTVQISNSRRQRWKTVAGCQELTAGQTCNLTEKLKDVWDLYTAQVRASRTNQTSQWTRSREFQPLTDTVLGPPDFSVSGCGNCLILQIRDSSWSRFDHNVQLKNLYWEVEFNVKRTRDGAEFRLKLPYEQKSVISHLQPGVEYCVSASFTSILNHNAVSSERHCAFTSPPPPRHTCKYLPVSVRNAAACWIYALCNVYEMLWESDLSPAWLSVLLVLGLVGGFSLVLVLVVCRVIFRNKVQKHQIPCMKFTSQPYSCLMTSLNEED
uniref:Interferon alpha/beta receptor 2 n=1 Tax=Fundulus heteroclitus TaxID=8078 RepID=A0A3Q2TTZ4_FUNHE